jgi:hypothetical protein
MKKISTLLLMILIIVVTNASGQDLDHGQIPFYAEPYYNYKPLKINIGSYSDSLKVNDAVKLVELSNNIRASIDNVPVEVLYILAVRLYDLGKKDESFYWFQTAKTRARIVIEMLDPKKIGSIGSQPFELKQLFLSFNQIVGIYINGYGFNDVDEGIATMEKVRNEVDDIKPYNSVYKNISFLSETVIEGIKADKKKELDEGLAYFKTNKEEIKKKRIEAGIQDKY